MKIKHVGPRAIGAQDGQDGESFQAFGVSFDHGGEAEIPDRHPDAKDIANRVHGNPHFELTKAPKGWEPPEGQDEPNEFDDDFEDDEKSEVIVRLESRGITVDKRRSLKSLKEIEATANAKGAQEGAVAAAKATK